MTHELTVTKNPMDAMTAIKGIVLNSVHSPHSRRAYDKALSDFLEWYRTEAPIEGFTKAVVQRYAVHLNQLGLSASTVNVRLTAVRRLAAEASDNGLLISAVAEGIGRVRGPKAQGARTGNWLTKEQAERLLRASDVSKLKGMRDRALLAVLIGCGLRRSEVSSLSFAHIQQREGRWVVVDLLGKGGKLRTVPMPSWAKSAIDVWTSAASLADGCVFRSMTRHGRVMESPLLPQNIMEVVITAGAAIGIPQLAPHDLRRTFAKLAHRGHAALEQIQLSLGHASIQTTERYLGVRQNLANAPCDALGLDID